MQSCVWPECRSMVEATTTKQAERITYLSATAFRGVRESIDFDLSGGKSLVILGDNGTGKSTVADIVEFFFSGEIAYLSKEGRQKSVRHAGASPGVRTTVEVRTTGQLGGMREYPDKGQSLPLLPPGDTYLLRGRTLSDFVNCSKSEKWQQLNNILGLGPVDALRLKLQTTANALGGVANDCAMKLNSASAALAVHGVEASEDSVWAEIRMLCGKMGVRPPDTFASALTEDWIREPSEEDRQRSDRSAFLAKAKSLARPPSLNPALAAWNATVLNVGGMDNARLQVVVAGQEYLSQNSSTDSCPLCGQPVEPESLRDSIATVLDELHSASEEVDLARTNVLGVLGAGESAYRARRDILSEAASFSMQLVDLPQEPFSQVRENIERHQKVDLLRIVQFEVDLSAWDDAVANAVSSAVDDAGPDVANPAVALGSLLTLAQSWSECVSDATTAERAAHIGHKLFESYQDEQRTYFASMLSEVSERASTIYAALHPGEAFDSVGIEPMREKGAELTVNFHGTVAKPPHGVLSESHLNSLAIALFIAMAETFNQKIGFLVLDDVVNSFDREHRARLAELLAVDLPKWQFIVLTHDEQFYLRLYRLAPTWQRMEFTSWSYEDGPRTTSYCTRDMRIAAQVALDNGDVAGGAQKARRAVEEFFQEACEGLGAPLAFKRGTANDHREIGSLALGLRSRLRALHSPTFQALSPLLTAIEADVQAALNVESHSSTGRAATTEIVMALERFDELVSHLTCNDCSSRKWKRGGPEIYSCHCRSSVLPRVDRISI
jgi:energy-coupling factor transporter ATP-binding protein EcfA2